MDEMKKMLETKQLYHDPYGSGYPGGSRDFWYIDIRCQATNCICNSGSGKCAVPSNAIIGTNGRCNGFLSDKERDE